MNAYGGHLPVARRKHHCGGRFPNLAKKSLKNPFISGVLVTDAKFFTPYPEYPLIILDTLISLC